ncbi:alpha/beta hydrolase [Dactylosporangium sp. AC04546]|uniref:alpha/beta fold hydrolase n=1 Tax=Dactylosporangium sp. AC04546 TaxID=2862460 RepID=UPI001EE094BE|nr:alpha/beta hydrolase [Dactylosporangium sp. AC04546]WVK81491.1 alpha/beta hydrolase [Dactylosporangium sp. AC04546]
MRLVLLHGIGSRWQLWRPVLPALEARFDVIALDFPGFGAAAPGGGSDVRALADWVQDRVGGPCHVAGSSMGGGVALELGRRGFARSVTAFSPIGFWGPLSRRWCQVSVTGARVLAQVFRPALPVLSGTKAGRVALYGLFFGHPTRVDPAEGVADAAALAKAPGFAAARAAFAHHRFEGTLPDIPVTIAWGTRDAILPAYQSRRARRLLPSARHEKLPGCGHLPFADDPARCADLITETATPRAAGT